MKKTIIFLCSMAFLSLAQGQFKVNTNDVLINNNLKIDNGGNFSVTGISALNFVNNLNVGSTKFSVAAATGNTAIGGTLGVTGAATFINTLTVNGTSNFKSSLFDLGSHDAVMDYSAGEPTFRPIDDSWGYLGTGTKRWWEVYAVRIYGNYLYANGVQITSDEKIKENLRSFSGSLNKISQLKGYQYDIKQEYLNARISEESDLAKRSDLIKDSKNQIGLLAQDVQKLFPELVKPVDTSGLLSINYIGLIPVLIEAIKEQQTEIKQIKEDNSTKTQQIEMLLADFAECCSKSRTKSLEVLSTQTELEQSKEEALLGNNIPNPFDGQTRIPYYIPTDSKSAEINVFDLTGKLLWSTKITSFGNGECIFDAKGLSAGLYNYALIVNDQVVDVKRMLLK